VYDNELLEKTGDMFDPFVLLKAALATHWKK
jgi:hypothetical protein